MMMTAQDIKSLRYELCLTQKGFAKILGVLRETVAVWEAGKFEPSADNRKKLKKLQAKLPSK